MNIFDVQGFRTPEVKAVESKPAESEQRFQSNDFDKTVTGVNPLVQMEVINSRYNMGDLLRKLGYEIDRGNMYCPFHPDNITGKPSARYHESDDKLWCFSEHKQYSAYHVLKILMGQNVNVLFRQIWSGMTVPERQTIIDKYGAGAVQGSAREISEAQRKWDFYHARVLSQFARHSVSYQQYKNALYKVLEIVQSE